MFPVYNAQDIPALTTQQMILVDRLMMQQYRIALVQMMENAGRNLAHVARHRFLDGDPQGKSVVILAGKGGNGGGVLVCARRLANWGASVRVFISHSFEEYTPVAALQYEILQQMGISISSATEIPSDISATLIIDGIIGYQLQGAPRNGTAQLIRWANVQTTPVLALDVPSGLDATSGSAYEPTIQASATMTLALPKAGLLKKGSSRYVGELYLADISVPPELYAEASLHLHVPPLFAHSEIVWLK